jgi:hypothetical protein
MRPGVVQLVKVRDEQETVLKQMPLEWEFARSYDLELRVQGATLRASVDGQSILETNDPHDVFGGGGIALVCEEGRCGIGPITIGA